MSEYRKDYGGLVKAYIARQVRAALPQGMLVVAGRKGSENVFFFKDLPTDRRWVARRKTDGAWVACRNTTFGPLEVQVASSGVPTATVVQGFAAFAVNPE